MFDSIKLIFAEEMIDRIGIIRIDSCEIINARLLPDDAKSVIIFCIPYRSKTSIPNDGFSEYARMYDYHKFSYSLFERILNSFRAELDANFYGFCDHSPINEKLAAAKSGLGVIGRNSLFIDNVYGSFVFLATIVTSAELINTETEIKSCENCGLCVSSCPNAAVGEKGIDRYKCLSGVSQKKNKTQDEIVLLKRHNIVWGCDICQLVCPHNIDAKISPIPYFSKTRIEHIDKEFIHTLSDEEFNKYAFSYKGRNIVLRNIDFI